MRKQGRSESFPSKVVETERALGRTLPAHIEAERSVLGALLLNYEYIKSISEVLMRTDLYNQEQKFIY